MYGGTDHALEAGRWVVDVEDGDVVSSRRVFPSSPLSYLPSIHSSTISTPSIIRFSFNEEEGVKKEEDGGVEKRERRWKVQVCVCVH